MPTALLICMENTFWNTGSRDGNFVESFKKSFTLYVDSGMRKKVEAEIEQGGGPVTKGDIYNFVIKHCLCKILCFYLHSTHLTTFFF